MTIPIGRTGQVYTKLEAAYGVEEALAATNALRHININPTFDPFQRVTSPEKKQSPGASVGNRFDRRKAASLSTLEALLRPSGVLNTLPECDPIIEAAFGSKTNRTEATTVASSPTTTGATVTSAGTLAVGDAVLLEVTGQTGRFVRVITNKISNALTWAPALPAAQSVGDDVKGCITYKLTSTLALSLTIAHYVGSMKRELLGCGIDSLSLPFDANEEPRFNASGPAADQLTGTAQAKPGSFTTVGSQPPSGLVGELYIDDTAYLFRTLEISLTNGLALRNTEYGVNAASEIYRRGRREISVSLNAYAETEATLYDNAESGTNVSVLKQTGRQEGSIVATWCPQVEFKVPTQDDPDEEVSWDFAGMALESSDGANDELSLVFA